MTATLLHNEPHTWEREARRICGFARRGARARALRGPRTHFFVATSAVGRETGPYGDPVQGGRSRTGHAYWLYYGHYPLFLVAVPGPPHGNDERRRRPTRLSIPPARRSPPPPGRGVLLPTRGRTRDDVVVLARASSSSRGLPSAVVQGRAGGGGPELPQQPQQRQTVGTDAAKV